MQKESAEIKNGDGTVRGAYWPQTRAPRASPAPLTRAAHARGCIIILTRNTGFIMYFYISLDASSRARRRRDRRRQPLCRLVFRCNSHFRMLMLTRVKALIHMAQSTYPYKSTLYMVFRPYRHTNIKYIL